MDRVAGLNPGANFRARGYRARMLLSISPVRHASNRGKASGSAAAVEGRNAGRVRLSLLAIPVSIGIGKAT